MTADSFPNSAGFTEVILAALQQRAQGLGDEFGPDPNRPDRYTIRCFQPEKHQNGDAHPSAFYAAGKYAVCSLCGWKAGPAALARALGITEMDIRAGLTLEPLADAKGLPADFLRAWGLRTQTINKQAAVLIPWYDMRGVAKSAPAYHRRHYLEKGDDLGPRWTWDIGRGKKLIPYGAWRIPEWLAEAKAGGIKPYLWIVESEIDALTLWRHRIPAVAIGGAGSWKSEWAAHFHGFARVLICQETGETGLTMVVKVAADLTGNVVAVPFPSGAKDANHLHLNLDGDTAQFQTVIRDLASRGVPAADIVRAAKEGEAKEDIKRAEEGLQRLIQASQGILDDPRLLDRMVEASKGLGHVGDTANQKALHLALATVKQGKPAPVIVKGPWSSGKNHLVESVVHVWPDDLYVFMSGASEKWLAYTDIPFAHRYVIFAEAKAVEEGFGAYLLRSLISEGRIEYGTVERTANGLVGKTISKEGPTGVITTTTKSMVDPELESRCWTLESLDSEGYLRTALDSVAARRNGGTPEPEDLPRLKAGLAWLLLAGETAVDITFAHWLAARMPAKKPDVLRLFDRLLAAIEASAWLHQRQRPRDDKGNILAIVRDYACVFDVFGQAFGQATRGLTVRQQEVLETVTRLAGAGQDGAVSLRAVARALSKNPGTISGHLKALSAKGYLVAVGEGGPWKPDADPPATSTLPTPAELACAFPQLDLPPTPSVSGPTPPPIHPQQWPRGVG